MDSANALDALGSVFADHPIPDTGDARHDLEVYLGDEQRILSTPRARAVIAFARSRRGQRPRPRSGARRPPVRPLRARFIARLEAARAAGQVDEALDLDLAADLLAGPVYYRALLTGEGLDGSRIGPALDVVLSATSV